MSKMSREKGKRGEREVVTILRDLLGDGYVFKRNLLDQCHDGGMDILGLPDWAIEVKNYKEATPSLIKGWWEQTVDEQAEVLAYIRDGEYVLDTDLSAEPASPARAGT